MKKLSLQNSLSSIVAVISLVCVSIVFALNLIFTAAISYDAYERITISQSVLTGILVVLVIGAVLYLFTVCKKYIDKIDVKKLFLTFTIVYLIAGMYLLLNVDNIIRADAGTVYNVAVALKDDNYGSFGVGGYCYRYPHQVGMVLYDRILQIFSSNVYFIFMANLAFVLGINYINYKISDMVFADKYTNILTIILSFAFLPQLFFILFAYGLIPGFFFMLTAFYFAIRFGKGHQTEHLVLTAVFAGVAVLLKKNFLIGAIAIVLYLLLTIKKEKLAKTLIAVASVALASVLVSQIAITYFESKSNQKLDNGTPSIMWIAMGTDLDNTGRAPGWYNSFMYNTYTDTGYDKEKTAEIGKEQLKGNLMKISEDPGRAFSFFTQKTVSQWCEPTYQSIWSGPLEDCGQNTYTKLLKSIYTGQTGAKVVTVFSKFLTMLIWAFAAVFLLKYRKETDGWQIAFMYFVGGLIFHTMWEGKSQYIYPYVFSVIPFVAYAFSKTSLQLAEKIKKNRVNKK